MWRTDGQWQQGAEDDWQQNLHDLRDALHGIQCGIEVLLEMPTNDAKQQRVLSMMQRDQETARRLVQVFAERMQQGPH